MAQWFFSSVILELFIVAWCEDKKSCSFGVKIPEAFLIANA